MALSQGLIGKRILMTRPKAIFEAPSALDPLSGKLQSWGAQVDHIALLEIHPKPWTLQTEPQKFDWLFFTSKNAVHAFFTVLKDRPNEVPNALSPMPPIATVGPSTAKSLKCYQQEATFISGRHDAESAAVSFIETYPGQDASILWPCGNLALEGLPQILNAAGHHVYSLITYETLLRRLTQAEEQTLLKTTYDMVIFTSPSTVKAYADIRQNLGLPSETNRPHVACLGPKTKEAALRLLRQVDVEAEPSTMGALGQCILQYYTQIHNINGGDLPNDTELNH